MVIGFAAVATLPQVGEAQGNSRARSDDIPVNARPPAGMCRVWLEDVPVAQQPAPTDCPTAVRNRTPKSRVIFGDDYIAKRDTTKGKQAPIKGFAPSKGSTRKPLLRIP